MSRGGVSGAFVAALGQPHVNLFPDMHNLGDAAVRAGLRDPVLDVDAWAGAAFWP